MLEIHLIGDSERSALFEMAQRYWAELVPRSPIVQDPALRPSYFDYQFRLGEPDNYQWWARVDGTNIGFANVQTSEDWTGEPWAYIKDFYIEPPWRRRSYGRAFACAIIDELAARSIYRVDLHARHDTPVSLAFWRSIGFELASYRLRTYLD